MTRYLVQLLLFALTGAVHAQSTAPPVHVQDVAKVPLAFTNATVHVDARTVLNKATLVVQDGRVLAVGTNTPVPSGAVVRDLKGAHIWPALVEPYSALGLPSSTSEERRTELRAARHWNGALRADARAHALFSADAKATEDLRAQGFATAMVHRMDGIARGTSAAMLLGDGPMPKAVLEADAAAHFSFRKGSSPDAYPGSQMGAIALLRQAFLDARWIAGGSAPEEHDPVLEALAGQMDGRMVVEAENRNEVLRWDRILKEAGLMAVVKGGGDEYARLDAIRATGRPLIVPVAFPEAFDVEDPYDALEVSLAHLSHWELAPHNAALLDSAGVVFALTTHGRKDLKTFWKDMRRMVACGLDSARAIEAFTSVPARLFGLDDRIGALHPGMIANFLVTSEHLLHERNTIQETWVQGKCHPQEQADGPKLSGTFDLNLVDAIWTLEVSDEGRKLEAHVRRPGEADSLKVKARIEREGDRIVLSFAPRGNDEGIIRLTGLVHSDGGLWDGQGQRPGGHWFAWSALRKAQRVRSKPARSDSLDVDTTFTRALRYPMGGFGWSVPPQPGTVLLRHATVWTNGPEGILRDTDVLVHAGKIMAVGKGLDVNASFPGKNKPVITEVDATGKHITSGIIDEHAHVAISRGVNEATHAITAEVRIGDVIDPDDINLYRSLSGGVTAQQLLHGSTNPIGGQSALIKLRWGHVADSLLIRDAPKHIKFALGENVKQSNWSSSSRFPQTRMGVEQVYYEAFHRARAYDTDQRLWNERKPKQREGEQAPRRDLRSEALAEILHGERHITCHSYVQGEIDMLLHVADSMGFKVNTLTHILEGYKMSAKMKRHGVNASTFSDWWAYKFEVYDAIPYNAALLQRAGVTVGINSDDAEMGRRLNQEAAKAVKYGGMSEEEAWKMVTLNPARMLKLDHRMGSVRPGMDADLVLWSDHPLSIRARAERTYVDGICYFSAE
jgi:imidazolonepropionase-like amidohydrolase